MRALSVQAQEQDSKGFGRARDRTHLPWYAETAGVSFPRRALTGGPLNNTIRPELNEKSLAQEEPVYEHVAQRGQYRAEFGTRTGDH